PKGRINEHTQMRGANNGKAGAPRPFQQLAAAIAAMMHQLLVVNIIKAGTSRNLNVCETAGPEDPKYLPQCEFVVIDVLQNIQRRHDIDAGIRQRTFTQVELNEGNARQPFSRA